MVYYAIVMPQHSDLPKGEAAEGEKKAKVTLASFGTQFWLYIIGMALAIASAAAFMNNIAMIVVGTGIDATGAAVATIMTGFTVGMMIGGAAYPLLYGLLKRAAMAVYLPVSYTHLAAICATSSVPRRSPSSCSPSPSSRSCAGRSWRAAKSPWRSRRSSSA